MKAYSAIAGNYEYLQKDYDYDLWSQYVIEKLSNVPNKTGVDVGAGTGLITRALADAGYVVTGTDVSYEMLNYATSVTDGKIPFIYQKAENFSGFSSLGFVTAVNDVVNYLTKSNAVKFFKKVYSSLASGGVFMFDVSSEYKLKNVIGNNTFTCEDENVSYSWNNYLSGDKVYMDLSVFTLKDDGTYNRNDESHVQYVHTKDFITSALKEIGFSVKVEGEYGKRLSTKTNRLTFVCLKK